MRLVKTDKEGWEKDLDSGAILNTDNTKLQAYKRRKAAAEQAAQASQRIDKLEKDVSVIKDMLVTITELIKNK